MQSYIWSIVVLVACIACLELAACDDGGEAPAPKSKFLNKLGIHGFHGSHGSKHSNPELVGKDNSFMAKTKRMVKRLKPAHHSFELSSEAPAAEIPVEATTESTKEHSEMHTSNYAQQHTQEPQKERSSSWAAVRKNLEEKNVELVPVKTTTAQPETPAATSTVAAPVAKPKQSTEEKPKRERLQLYDEKKWIGTNHVVFFEGSGCVELPPEWQARARSVHVGGLCVKLFEEEHCEGENVRIESYKFGHQDLADVHFDHRFRSFRKCK